MDICDKIGIKSTFYFIPENSEDGNGCYSLEDKKIQNLLSYINDRGHYIGVHGSYQTYNDKNKAKKQKDKLQFTLDKLKINQKIIGNRQHYLRWDSSITPSILDEAKFEYDTTGAYADRIGFRYGVCCDFSMFDMLNRKKLNIKQRPLTVMECTVIDDMYMGYGYTKDSIKVMKNIKNICKKYNGNFSLLWHNSHFKNSDDKKIFEEVLIC
jgi:hypothetical protein